MIEGPKHHKNCQLLKRKVAKKKGIFIAIKVLQIQTVDCWLNRYSHLLLLANCIQDKENSKIQHFYFINLSHVSQSHNICCLAWIEYVLKCKVCVAWRNLLNFSADMKFHSDLRRSKNRCKWKSFEMNTKLECSNSKICYLRAEKLIHIALHLAMVKSHKSYRWLWNVYSKHAFTYFNISSKSMR